MNSDQAGSSGIQSNRRTGVLVVDDDPHLLKALRITLQAHGYAVESAADGGTALRAASHRPPDVMILDLGLPDLDGAEVLRELRRWSNLPVLVLSARHGSSDKVDALDAGADDYITKPFSLRELSARVRAVLRRGRGEVETASVYRGEHLSADFDAVNVHVDGRPIRLTRREFELLKYLVDNRNRVLSRDRLLERVWGYDRIIETRSVDVHVGRLRTKLGTAGHQIETVVGLGYRFVD